MRLRKSDKELAQKALDDATQRLNKVRSRDAEVHEVCNALRQLRERNHFAEQLRTVMGGTIHET